MPLPGEARKDGLNGPHRRESDGDSCPSPRGAALRRAHVALIASGVAFAFGFALYTGLSGRAGSPLARALVAAVSALSGLALAAYLRAFLRRPWRRH